LKDDIEIIDRIRDDLFSKRINDDIMDEMCKTSHA